MGIPCKSFVHFWFRCCNLSLSSQSLSVLRETAWMEWSHSDLCSKLRSVTVSLCNVTTYEMDSILLLRHTGNLRLRLRGESRWWCVVTCELLRVIGQCFVWMCVGVRHGTPGAALCPEHGGMGLAAILTSGRSCRYYITQILRPPRPLHTVCRVWF